MEFLGFGQTKLGALEVLVKEQKQIEQSLARFVFAQNRTLPLARKHSVDSLGSVYVCSVRTFGAVAHFKRYFITLFEIIELNVLELCRVKEQVFFFAGARNKTKSSFSNQPSNCSFLHRENKNKLSNTQKQDTVRQNPTTFSFSSDLNISMIP
jgi:hypothetical protein